MTPRCSAWPDRRTRPSLAVGDVVELSAVRYRITALHMTDEGVLARLTPTGGTGFVMAHELVWDGAMWRTGSEAELREAWGR